MPVALKLLNDSSTNSSTIEVAQSVKSLGVHFDKDMTLNNRTDFLAGKVSQIAGLTFSLFSPLH